MNPEVHPHAPLVPDNQAPIPPQTTTPVVTLTPDPAAPLTGPSLAYTAPQIQQPANKKPLINKLLIPLIIVGVMLLAALAFGLTRKDTDPLPVKNSTPESTPVGTTSQETLITGSGYSFKVPKDAVRKELGTSTAIVEQYQLTSSDPFMIVTVLVEKNASASSFLANGAANTLTARFRKTTGYKEVTNKDATVTGSTQGYLAEIVSGRDPSVYIVKAAVLKDGKTTVALQITYPQSLDAKNREVANTVLNSLVIK